MNNIFNYLEYYKNVSMRDYTFNSIDSLMFSLLSYVDLGGIVPSNKKEYIYLDDAIDLYLDKYKNVNKKTKNWLFPNCYKLMETLKGSLRYKDMKLYYGKEIIDDKAQFCAITIRINKITYISYRGTDSSIVGWREDFEMFYKDYVPSHKLALSYFEDTINFFDRNIYLGGHSKGGNLAMYAYMYGNSNYKKRVIRVYNYDGPGLLSSVIDKDKILYDDLINKLVTVVPSYSMVGMVLNNTNYYVVNCKDKGIWAHDGFNWEVFGGFFVEADLSKKSSKINNNLNEYIRSMSIEERESFVENTFNIFKKLGIVDTRQIHDLKINDIVRLIKDIKNIPNQTKLRWINIIKLMFVG